MIVDEVGYTILKGSLQINSRIEERSTASFTIIDLDGDLSFEEGYPVLCYDADDVLIFGGCVDSVEMSRLAPTGGRFHKIQCRDNHYLADKRLAAQSYESKTCGFIVADLLTKYLTAEGVTIGEIQDGPVCTEVVINYARVSDAIAQLAEMAGFIWYIDENKALYFIDRATNAAPWTFTNLKAVEIPHLTDGNPRYRNRQYIKGTSVTDTQTETFTGDGQTMSFALGYPVAQVPTVTVQGLPATVGIKGLEQGKQFYWSKGDAILACDTPPTSGHIISVSYKGQFPVVVLSEDKAEIQARQEVERAGTGYVEDIEDAPATTSIVAAWQAAAGKLQMFCRNSRRFRYKTDTSGLYPGQLQPIDYPLLGLDTDMLIESVTIRGDGDYLTYDVVCIEGPEVGDWSQLFKTLADQARLIMDRVNVGLGDTLIILQQTQEYWGWQESVDETVYVCSAPADSGLYPADSGLYPC